MQLLVSYMKTTYKNVYLYIHIKDIYIYMWYMWYMVCVLYRYNDLSYMFMYMFFLCNSLPSKMSSETLVTSKCTTARDPRLKASSLPKAFEAGINLKLKVYHVTMSQKKHQPWMCFFDFFAVGNLLINYLLNICS